MRGRLACAFTHVLKNRAVNDLEGLFLDKSEWLPEPVILEPGCTVASTGVLWEMLVPGSFPGNSDFISLMPLGIWNIKSYPPP